MENNRTKNATVPEEKGSAQHRDNVEGRTLIHSRIFLCNCQGVVPTTLKAMKLASLLNDEPDIPDESEGRAS